MTLTSEEILKKAAELEKAGPEAVLSWGLNAFGDKIALASSFQCEESVLIDMMHKLAGSRFRVFTLDTGRLNEETYEVMEAMRMKYGIQIESQFPEREAVEKLEKEKGLFSFRDSVENRKECCRIRKVAPLNRILGTLDAWITGLRAEQSPTRAETPKIEIGVPKAGMTKINPLVDWTSAQIWEYIKKNNVPYNRLHDVGYPSIGCAPCTRAVKPGEDVRAGRWWWENPENKECGIHANKS